MTRTVEYLGVALLTVAYLLPVGDAPWHSFWRDWTALIGVLLMTLAMISALRTQGLPFRLDALSLPTLAFSLAALCWVQFTFGLVPYVSDALLPSLYLVAFGLCVLIGGSLPLVDRVVWSDRLAAAMCGAALVSVPLAVLQWLRWLGLDMNMPVAGGRPVAHMEQANLLCSLLIQGLFGVWRLADRRRVGIGVAFALGIPILLTIVLTQSRVAWLVAAAVLVGLAWRRQLLIERSWRPVVSSAFLVLVVGTLALPSIDAHLGLKGAALAERISEGRRPAAWSLFIDAVLDHFWTGWGALQNGAAQFAMADRHPSLGYSFSSAHNFVLDLMVWFGVPIGLLAGVAVLAALARRIRHAADSATLVSALAASALALHGLVELPLHYAYFLLPFGLYLGLTTPEPGQAHTWEVPTSARAKVLLPALSLAAASMLALLGGEYIRATNVRPVLAFDKPTRHLMLVAELAPPEIVLLDQLRAYHEFAALKLARGTSPIDLELARVAMQRTPFPTSIERYALLSAINGRNAEARKALSRVCKFEPPAQCAGSQRAWLVWREQWPGLIDWRSESIRP